MALFSVFLNPEEETSLYETTAFRTDLQLLNGYPNESWIYAENQIVSLVNIEDIKSDNFKDSIRHSIHLLSRNGYPVKAGIGSPIDQLTLAHLSYSAALEALSYRV